MGAKKINLFSVKGIFLGFVLMLLAVPSYSQTKDDVGILREEILDKMQDNNQNVQDLIQYYSKISYYDAQILNVKFLLLKGEYETALIKIFALQKTAEEDKQSDKYFQYLCIYAEVCRTLGLTTEVDRITKDLKASGHIKESFFTDLALDHKSFDIFPLGQRLEILNSSISKYKRSNDVQSLIQANVWLSEILRNSNGRASESALDNALTILEQSQTSIYYHILTDNLRAGILYERKEAPAAFDLLKKNQQSISSISSKNLKKDFFHNLARSSAMVGNLDRLQSANASYIQIVEDDMAKKAVARAMLVKHIGAENDEKLKAQTLFFKTIYIGITVFFIIGLILIYIFNKKNLRSKKQVVEVIADPKNFVIPDKTEKRILDQLAEFEKGQKYILKNVSLKTLSQQFDTNPKYLSEVINKHKNSNFNTYINNLRIDYIVDKINKDPKYRKYKVSYLADECGFSSHSLFTTIFKNRMNLSPTEYLQKLSE